MLEDFLKGNHFEVATATCRWLWGIKGLTWETLAAFYGQWQTWVKLGFVMNNNVAPPNLELG
jgi:hypothetical protein